MKRLIVIVFVVLLTVVITSCNKKSEDSCYYRGTYTLHKVVIEDKLNNNESEFITYELGSNYFGMVLNEEFMSFKIKSNYRAEGYGYFDENTKIELTGKVLKNSNKDFFTIELDEPSNFGFDFLEPLKEIEIIIEDNYYIISLDIGSRTFHYYTVKK